MVLQKWRKTCRAIKLDLYLTLLTKINLKWFKGLNIKPDTVLLLEENAGKKLFAIGYDIENTKNKSKNQQMELHQTLKLLHSKINNKMKGNLQNRRKILQTIDQIRS